MCMYSAHHGLESACAPVSTWSANTNQEFFLALFFIIKKHVDKQGGEESMLHSHPNKSHMIL